MENGILTFQHTAARRRLDRQTGRNSHLTHGFNTQPPEDGWSEKQRRALSMPSFNTQPPEDGWDVRVGGRVCAQVSTHSRPKTAGKFTAKRSRQLKFQHTAARRRLENRTRPSMPPCTFQHTAARRRLGLCFLIQQ